MAAGDIINAEIIASGWQLEVTIEGWGARAGTITYAYDADGTPLLSLAVTSEGYNGSGVLGTVARTVLGTTTNRQPYPNEALLQEVVSGPDLIVRIALSEFVYNDDRNGGAGTSGVDPVLTISAGWATSSVGPASVPPTVFTVGNNSAMDYPVAFGQWDPYAGVLTSSRVKANFVLAFNARHGHGIACVRFNAVGNTSAVDTELFATTQTGTQRTATSLYGYAHQVTIPIAGYTQGETITSRARVYPKVGDADSVQDTNGRTTSTDECLGWNAHTLICDKSNLLDVIRYVSTTGNDTTGTGTSGNPWLTIAKAVFEAGVNVVRLMGSGNSYNLGSSRVRRTTSEWVIVEPDVGATGVIAITTATRNYRCQRLQLRNLEIRSTGTTSYLDGEALGNFIAFVGCTFNRNGIAAVTTGPAYRSDCGYFINCTGDLSSQYWSITSFSSARVAQVFDGITFDPTENGLLAITAWYRFMACTMANTPISDKPAANVAPTQAGVIYECNKIINNTMTSAADIIITLASGVSLMGNIIERQTAAATAPLVQVLGDNRTVAASNYIVAHNTIVGQGDAGERVNLFYNDIGSTAIATYPMWIVANQIAQCNIKADLFTPQNANRVGNWPVVRGTGMRSNNFDTASSTSFEWEYGGLNFTEATPTFVDAANNDYMPVAGDGLTNRVTNGYLPGDLFGTLRTTMDVGAVQRPADPPPSGNTARGRERSRSRLMWF
jgi:hypothetical protein